MLWLALRLPQLSLDVFSKAISCPQSPLVVYHQVHNSKKIFQSNDTAETLGVRKGMSLVTAEALLQATDENLCRANSISSDQSSNASISSSSALTGDPLANFSGHTKTTTTNVYYCFSRDISREWVALQHLAGICYEFTPHISLHNTPPLTTSLGGDATLCPGLLLEISGSLKLFKGQKNLCSTLSNKVKDCGYFAQLGLGPSPEGAWLLSTQTFAQTQYTNQQYWQSLGSIELNRIDCFIDAFDQLQKMGLQQLQQVFAMPMVELGRRFGEAFIAYLHMLLGKKTTTLIRRTEPKKFHKRAQLNYPIVDLQQLQPVILNLLQQLAQFLRREQLQCESIEWLLLSATGERLSIIIVCQPVHGDWNLLQQLTDIHFENITLDFEIDSVELLLDQFSHFHLKTEDLFANDAELALNNNEMLRRWQLLLTRLHNRLGSTSTLGLNVLSEHWPEQLNSWIPCTIQNINHKEEGETLDWIDQLHQNKNGLPNTHALAPRPSWLIDPPTVLTEYNHQLIWQGPLTLLMGPERLQGQWWLLKKNDPVDDREKGTEIICRDYFIAEHNDYRRVWIYYDYQSSTWYLQGVFS